MVLQMDDVCEQIASRIGSKWTQLYSLLPLEIRGRYRIGANHRNKKPPAERYRSCARDTLQQWRACVSELDETDALRELLVVLKKIQGCADLVDELCSKYDISLEPPVTHEMPPPSESHDSSNSYNTREQHLTSLISRDSAFQEGEESFNSVSSTEEEPVDTQAPEGPPRAPPPKLPIQQISMTDPSHKYAILDICQRLGPEYRTWKAFASELGLSKQQIQKIKREEQLPEERYYLALKQWTVDKKTLATFASLGTILEKCNQSDLIKIILERLNSHML